MSYTACSPIKWRPFGILVLSILVGVDCGLARFTGEPEGCVEGNPEGFGGTEKSETTGDGTVAEGDEYASDGS